MDISSWFKYIWKKCKILIAGSLIHESLWRKAYGLLILHCLSSGMEIGNKILPYSSAQCCFCCSSAWFLLFVCPVCTNEWGRTGKEWGELWLIPSCSQPEKLSGCRELKCFTVRMRRERTLVLQVSDLKGETTHHNSTIPICHTPFLPIYSHAAIENHLKTHDWN